MPRQNRGFFNAMTAWSKTTIAYSAWTKDDNTTEQVFTYLYGTPKGLLLTITEQTTGNVTVDSPPVNAYAKVAGNETSWSKT